MTHDLPPETSDGTRSARLRQNAEMRLISPREAARQRYVDLRLIAEEYDRLLAALLILAEGEPDRYQDDLWAKYVAGRASATRRRRDTDEPVPRDPAFEALVELLDL